LARGDSTFTLCLLGEEADYTSDIYTVPLSLKLNAVRAFTSKTRGSSAGCNGYYVRYVVFILRRCAECIRIVTEHLTVATVVPLFVQLLFVNCAN
jgi:hypothetical protein